MTHALPLNLLKLDDNFCLRNGLKFKDIQQQRANFGPTEESHAGYKRH